MSQKIKPENARIPVVEQWIEVTHENGQTLSTFIPTNEEITRRLAEKRPTPELIYRRIFFVNGVPKEYEWICPPSDFKTYGGLWMHRMLPADWPEVLLAESLLPVHHMIPGKRPQGRPASHGPCLCKQCTEAREKGTQRFPELT